MKLTPIILAAIMSSMSVAACAPNPATTDEQMTLQRPGNGGVCKAEDWQSYVGKTRQSLPAAPQGLTFRVLCSTCAATMDYRQDRVTFTYDDKDIVTRASCG